MALIMAAIGIAVPLCLSTFAVENRPATPVAPTKVPTQASLTTISVLFIGVDALTATEPVLESLTVVKYQTEIGRFLLLALSPDTVADLSSANAPPKTIRSFFAEDARHQRQSWVTQAALQNISPELGGIYAEVDFDRQTISDTIGLLEPFACIGQTQTAESLLRRFDSLAPSAKQERLQFQGDLLQCLFAAAQKQNWDFPKLMESLGRRFFPTREVATVVLEAAPLLSQSKCIVRYFPLNPFGKPTPKP